MFSERPEGEAASDPLTVPAFEPRKRGGASAVPRDDYFYRNVWSRDGVMLEASRAVLALMGAPEHGVGRSVFEMFPAEFASERLRLIRHVIDTEERLLVLSMNRGVRLLVAYSRVVREDGSVGCQTAATTNPAVALGDLAGLSVRVVAPASLDPGPLSDLTIRELEVLRLIGQGLTTREIAKALHRSERTVNFHRENLGRKLEVKSRVQLARIAVLAGLESMPPEDLSRLSRRG